MIICPQVGSQRVWDYAGDNYVHRLIQTKEEGKVVEFEPQHDSACAAGLTSFADEEKVRDLCMTVGAGFIAFPIHLLMCRKSNDLT